MKESIGGVTHVGVSREGFMWWCHRVVSHVVELRGGVKCWSQVVESRGGFKGWWCHMKESLGGVTHVGVPCEGFTWWCHVMESRGGGVT
jgi:hypothetical protein